MLPNPNFNFLIDIALVLGAILYTARIVYLKVNPQSVLHKYKQGTLEYKMVSKNLSKAFSNGRLAVAIVVVLFFVLKTILDVRTIIEVSRDAALGQILFITVFAGLLCLITIPVVYFKIKRRY
jgi:hypothetical protein